MKRNIYLTGFMGSGKSRVGRLLSQKLNRPFIDTDQEIEKSKSQSVTEIFETLGETKFREIEASTILALKPNSGLVVSLGGGATMNPQIRDHLRQDFWVFLDTPFDVIAERVLRTSHRPLAKTEDQLKALYETRLSIYREAPEIISNFRSSESVCQEIIRRIIQNAQP